MATTRTTTGAAAEPGRGVSVRVRITATVTALVALALAGAGLVVFVVESDRIDERAVRESQQELDEFVQSRRTPGTGGATGRAFDTLAANLEDYLASNVPDADELLVGVVVGGSRYFTPPGEQSRTLLDSAVFRDATAPLVTDGGSVRLDTDQGRVLVDSQPVRQDGQQGALLVVSFLDPGRRELLDTIRTYAIVSALSLLLVGGVAFWRSGRLLRPLRTVRETADEITVTDLSRRLPVSGNDDVTALTRTVNTMLDRLEAAFVAQREFLDDAGHELRTPLTVLRGHLELLDPTDPADVAETRALLLDETDRMARLVGDLIVLAKADRPDFLAPRTVEVSALTETVLAKARGLGPRTWVLDGRAAGHAHVDEQRLTQALLQLADNAVKHTTGTDEVAIGSARGVDHLELWVRDTGPGVPLDDRGRIFQRFGRGSVPDGDEGFGLGLSIVAAIARAHGGDVRLDDAHDGGARFVLRLPTDREES